MYFEDAEMVGLGLVALIALAVLTFLLGGHLGFPLATLFVWGAPMILL